MNLHHRLLARLVCAVALATSITAVIPSQSNPVHAFGHGFVAVTPARLMDTRPGETTIDGQFLGAGTFGVGTTRDLTVAGRGGVPATGVVAVALNVTAIQPATNSFVTVFPTGTTRPSTSNLNTAAGRTMPNMVIVRLGAAGQVSVFNNAGSTHLAVDVLGWYGNNSGFTGLDPKRLMDTRPGEATVDGQFLGAGTFDAATTRTLQIAGRGGVPASGVTAVALNVTAIQPSANSFITIYPNGTSRPTASNLNTAAGRTLPNMVIVKLGAGGQVDIFNNSGSTHLAVDVLGWYGANADQTATSPARLLDTRPGESTIDGQFLGGGAFAADTTRTLQVSGRGGVPATGVTAVVLNVTAIQPSSTSFITIYPGGAVRPIASNLNTAAARTAPNLVVVKLSTNGSIDIFNKNGTTHLAIDVLAWYGSAFPVPPAPANGSQLVHAPIDTGVYGGGSTAAGADSGQYGVTASMISRDGKRVVFSSRSSNLVAADTNGAMDVFIVTSSGTGLERASVDVNGDQLPSGATGASISDNARYVVFSTVDEADPVADTDSLYDVYRFDRTTGEVLLVSVDAGLTDAIYPSISGNGRMVSYVNQINVGLEQLFVRDITAATTQSVAITEDLFSAPEISGDGTAVVWTQDPNGSTTPAAMRYDVATATATQYPLKGVGTNDMAVNTATDVIVSYDGDTVAYKNTLGLFTSDGTGGYIASTRIDVTSTGTNGTGVTDLGGFVGETGSVLFRSTGGLVPGVGNSQSQVYLRSGGQTTLISRTSAGAAASCASSGAPTGGGAVLRVAYVTCADNLAPGVVRDQNRLQSTVTDSFTSTLLDLPSQSIYAHGESFAAAIAPDGQALIYASTASDVDNDDLDDFADAFVFDIRHGPNELISADDGAVFSATTSVGSTTSISNGGAVAVYGLRDPVTGQLNVAIRTRATNDVRMIIGNAESRAPQISADGRWVLFESFASNLVTGDLNNSIDLFLFDAQTLGFSRITQNENGDELVGNTDFFQADISADGRYIVWQSNATNLFSGSPGRKVIRLDRQTGTMTMVSLGADPSISDDGSVVVFETAASLVGSDTDATFDVYRKDLATSALTLVSLPDDDNPANAAGTNPTITGNGRYVLFTSASAALVAGDTNGKADLFRRDLTLGTTVRVNIGPNGQQMSSAGLLEDGVGISDDGGLVVFSVADASWAASDDNGEFDVYLYRVPA